MYFKTIAWLIYVVTIFLLECYKMGHLQKKVVLTVYSLYQVHKHYINIKNIKTLPTCLSFVADLMFVKTHNHTTAKE